MFKYIGYDLSEDKLIASNNKFHGYIMGNAPQQFEYFSTLEEALEWLKANPRVHEEYMEDFPL